MDLPVILSVVLTLLSTQAEHCSEDQRCSKCSRTTTYCSTECFPGYFGLKCNLPCSENCKQKKCSQTKIGTHTCSDGCVPGYQGSQCNIPCTSPKVACTKCPQGCDETFCNLTSSCVAGCYDHYYGSNCKSCSPRCRHCNKITGRCDVCRDPYHGLDCEYSCELSSTNDCVQRCAPGLYGSTCSKRCNQNCLVYPANNSTLTSNSSNSYISECQRYSGECVNGCVGGWSGLNCSSQVQCNSNCLGCNGTGACVQGCLSGYFGEDCQPCSKTCYNHTCQAESGFCDNGCIRGHYGQSCQLSCTNCPGGVCDANTGICAEDQNGAIIGMSTAFGLLVFGIIVTVGLFYCKRAEANREEGHQPAAMRPQCDTNRRGNSPRRHRMSEHIYNEVNEDEMGPVIVFL